MKLEMSIKLDNAGVDPRNDGGAALGMMVEMIGVLIADGDRARDVRDMNGNLIGRWSITES